MNKIISQAILRLLANAYAPTPAGEQRHRSDVALLVSSLKDVPADAARWRWLREHFPLTALHEIVKAKFCAPDKAYTAEVDETIDKTIAAWRPRDEK